MKWYLSYCATGQRPGGSPGSNTPCHKVTDESPMEFIERCNTGSDKYHDGPYVLVFAMQITEDEYNKLKDEL